MQPTLDATGIISEDEIGANETVIYYYDFQNSICSSDIIIPEQIDGKNVIGIGYGSFYDAETYETMGIKSIEFPNTIEKIGAVSFTYNFIETLDLPSNLNTIGFNAFSGNQLTSVELPSSICP